MWAETSGSTITEGSSGSTFYLSGCYYNLRHLFSFPDGPVDIFSFGPGEGKRMDHVIHGSGGTNIDGRIPLVAFLC